MATTTNEARLAGLNRLETVEATESIRYAQNTLLSELPGVVFAFLTLGYVITSFLTLLQ